MGCPHYKTVIAAALPSLVPGTWLSCCFHSQDWATEAKVVIWDIKSLSSHCPHHYHGQDWEKEAKVNITLWLTWRWVSPRNKHGLRLGRGGKWKCENYLKRCGCIRYPQKQHWWAIWEGKGGDIEIAIDSVPVSGSGLEVRLSSPWPQEEGQQLSKNDSAGFIYDQRNKKHLLKITGQQW